MGMGEYLSVYNAQYHTKFRDHNAGLFYSGGAGPQDGFAMRSDWQLYRALYFFCLFWLPFGVSYCLWSSCMRYKIYTIDELTDKVFSGAVQRKAGAHMKND
jgi:hypothetical protein